MGGIRPVLLNQLLPSLQDLCVVRIFVANPFFEGPAREQFRWNIARVRVRGEGRRAKWDEEECTADQHEEQENAVTRVAVQDSRKCESHLLTKTT